jgi:prolyl-tRNA editing enzyme YbaK/EbsC (Cys-tRNA(Pro) deacylase)
MAPTLILQSEKGYLAAIIPGDRRLVYKKIKKELGLKMSPWQGQRWSCK